MTDSTRRSVLAAVGTALATAGCVTDSESGPTEENPTSDSGGETTTRETTEEPTTTEKTSGDWIAEASNDPDPDHSVSLENDADAARTVRVRIVRAETDETVFETTETVDSGYEVQLYNLKQADPEGVEAFEICAELVEAESTSGEPGTTTAAERSTTTSSDRRSCVTVQTNECYGNAHVTVREDDSVQVIYAIC